MADTQDFIAQTKALVDKLKSTCAQYGLGNDGNEYKIIVQIAPATRFLLGDEFGYSPGKNVIGKLTYTYNGKEAGGGNILYSRNASQSLSDSINMDEWFEEAVEKANTPAFPWKIIVLLLVIAALIAASATFVIYRAREHQAKSRRRHHYRKLKNRDKPFYRQ